MAARRSFLGDLRIVLRGRDFRRLFVVRLSSQASDGAFQIALTSLFFFSPERAATPSAAAAAFTAAVLPYTLVGPFAGVLLDVWPRRQVLLVANTVRAAMVVALALLVGAGVVGWPLYAGALACLSVNRFFLAGLGASLPHVVPRHELVMANAVSPTSGAVAALLGAGVGYAQRGLLGAGDTTDALVLLLAAAGYLASAGLATRIPRDLLGPDRPGEQASSPPPGVPGPRQVVRDVLAGARHVRERAPAARALTAIGVHRIGYGMATLAAILLCRNRLTDSADVDAGLALIGAVFGASGAGFAVAALLTPPAVAWIGERRWIVACCTACALLQLALVTMLGRTTLVVAAFVFGVGAQGIKICVDAIVQRSVDDAFRGRVFSFYDVVFNAAFVSAAALGAVVLPLDGFSVVVFTLVALLYAVTGAGYWVVTRGDPPVEDDVPDDDAREFRPDGTDPGPGSGTGRVVQGSTE